MAVYVSFIRAKGILTQNAPGIAGVRKRETLTVPDDTTNTLDEDEYALVFNGEATPIFCAFGRTPLAEAATETATTSAGFAIGAGQSAMVVGKEGDKLDFKAPS